ncbi:hypothetical protein PMKS-002214 [Pichia membranifaciens]|uniref:SHSP domain-containing protein n=1 Tax=Pichia membranifaciens TaxID=4926 RepID=A0A1Q2YGR7_9ASCO|nr:hypothetical protein PMKS-002214 [Pichia membranifaciens]
MDPFLQQLLAYQQAQAQAKAHAQRPQKYPQYPGYFSYGELNDEPYGPSGFGGFPRGYLPSRSYGGYGRSAAPFYPQPSYFHTRKAPSAYYDNGEDEEYDPEEADEGVGADDGALHRDAAVPTALSNFGLSGDVGDDEDEEGQEEETDDEDGSNTPGYQLSGVPLKGASGYPRNVIYFTRPKAGPKSKVVSSPEYSGLPLTGSNASIPTQSSYRTFDPSAFAAKNKRQRQQKQPMYIMDRYGNLYPYQPSPAAAESYPSERRDIDANQLIRMLLGAGDQKDEGDTLSKQPEEGAEKSVPGGQESQQQRDLEAAALSEAINDELEAEAKLANEKAEAKPEKSGPETISAKPPVAVEETPLTREGLADILSQLAKSEEAKPLAPPPIAEAGAAPPPNVIPMPQKLRRRSTAPSLNVHKVDKSADEASSVASANKKPIVVADVKVSAPQLKRKNLPFSPPLNVYEFKSKYIVVISLPGVSKEFVEIDYHPTNNELIIKGEAKNKYLSDDDEAANSFVLKVSEQRFGNFERIVKLPAYPGIEDTQIKAKFINGLLEIKLPKVDESKLQKDAKKIVLEDVPDEELERESGKEYI